MIRKIISAFFTRGLVAVINLVILLVSSRQLGAEIVGQVSLLILNITIIQIVNEVYTGYSLVHFLARLPLRGVYLTGLAWTLVCVLILNGVFVLFNIGAPELCWHVLALSFMGITGSFHSVILLSRERTKAYNFQVFIQPAVLLSVLCINVFVLQNKSTEAYISALYVSFGLTLLTSLVLVARLLSLEPRTESTSGYFMPVIRNGFINQAGNLAHTLSNRLNFYLIGSTVLIGVFSRASSLIESVWLVGASITPLVLTRVANQQDDALSSRLAFLLSKISLIVTLLSVVVILCLPQRVFVMLLGEDFSGIKSLMLYLSPGVVCIGFSTVLSHYFSGTGEQKVQLLSNCLGLLTTLLAAPFLIARYQLAGACYAASLSYFVQATMVTWLFMRRKEFKIKNLFRLKNDLELLRNNI